MTSIKATDHKAARDPVKTTSSAAKAAMNFQYFWFLDELQEYPAINARLAPSMVWL